MKLKDQLTNQDKTLFKAAAGKVKPMVQDTIHAVNRSIKKKPKSAQEKKARQVAEFHFSDEFEPDLNSQGPMKYVRHDVDSFEAKNLRRGEYVPDLILYLHGLDKHQANQ